MSLRQETNNWGFEPVPGNVVLPRISATGFSSYSQPNSIDKDIDGEIRYIPGPPGPPGPSGDTGKTGMPGLNGRDGSKGIKGERGMNGLNGLRGPKGECEKIQEIGNYEVVSFSFLFFRIMKSKKNGYSMTTELQIHGSHKTHGLLPH